MTAARDGPRCVVRARPRTASDWLITLLKSPNWLMSLKRPRSARSQPGDAGAALERAQLGHEVVALRAAEGARVGVAGRGHDEQLGEGAGVVLVRVATAGVVDDVALQGPGRLGGLAPADAGGREGEDDVGGLAVGRPELAGDDVVVLVQSAAEPAGARVGPVAGLGGGRGVRGGEDQGGSEQEGGAGQQATAQGDV